MAFCRDTDTSAGDVPDTVPVDSGTIPFVLNIKHLSSKCKTVIVGCGVRLKMKLLWLFNIKPRMS